MIIFLTTTGTEFQTPGNTVIYYPYIAGIDPHFAVLEKNGEDSKLVAQVRASEVVGWYVMLEEKTGEEEKN